MESGTTLDEQPKLRKAASPAPAKNVADASDLSPKDAPAAKPRRRKPTSSGLTGHRVISGYLVDEEKNTSVKGETAYTTYDLMRRTDAECHEALEILKTPMLVCPFVIEPASQEPIDREIADFVASNLFEDLAWNQIHEESLLRFDFGVSLLEQITDAAMVERRRFPNLPTVRSAGRPKNGEMVPAVRWTAFELRHPRTVRKWIPNPQFTTRLDAVVQYFAGDDTRAAGEYTISSADLLRFTHRQEAGNYAGRSKLRPMFADHRESNHLRKVEAVRHERQNCGLPVFTEPDQADPTDREQLADTAEALSAYEQSYLMLPFGWGFKFDTSGEGNGTNIGARLDKLRRGKLGAVLGGFMAQGDDGVGSNALIQGKAARQIDYVEVEIRNTESTWNRGSDGWAPIKTLVDMNYGARRLELGSHGYPKLRAKNVRRQHYLEVIRALTALGQSGFISQKNHALIERYLLQALEIDGPTYVAGDEGDDGRDARTGDEKADDEKQDASAEEPTEPVEPEPAPAPAEKPVETKKAARKSRKGTT